ncbi:protein MAIN-LIKE 1-like [Arachis duranensis]|uniref:Protein MAIN-LIKE 1-like n=1 Tax=Arachis duranensis TaxID=130453 RepID=A0A9C6WGT5_ARADU|nr:protein MAIN-LIKE 1-like [Arachis duranensis]
MPLHERIIPYLETAGLYHLARLNSQWFWVDEPLLSAFIERWRPETHTFHMPFGECTVTSEDVAYQLGLPIYGEPVSGCLSEFENFMENGRPAWVWFRDLFGELPPQNKVKQMTVCYTWFHERFRVLPADATDDIVRIYARAYIMMLLSSQLFADKNANCVHLRWLPYVASWRTWVDIAGARPRWRGCTDVFVVEQTETLSTWLGHYSFYSLGSFGDFLV